MTGGYFRTIAGFNVNVKLILLRTLIMGLYLGIYGVIFNLYIIDLGYREDFLGLVLSVHLIASALASIPAGILCDRIDRRIIMIASGVLSTIITIPMFITASPGLLLLLSGLSGVFISLIAVSITPFLSDNCRTDETVHVFSANASLSWISTVAGCALGGVIPGIWRHIPVFRSAGDYRLTLLASCGLLIICCITLLLLKPIKKTGHCSGHPLRALKPSPDAIRFTVTSLTFGIGSGMIVPYFNVYFVKVMNASVMDVGLASAVAGAFMIAGLFITPYVASRIGKIRSAVFTKILAAPCLILMALSADFLIAAAAYVGYMFFINMAGPATTSFQMERLPRSEQGMALGFMSTGSYLAISTSTYLGGWLIARGDYITPFLATCGAYLLTAVLLYHYYSKAEAVSVPIRKCGALLRTFIADLFKGRMEA